MKPSKLHCYVCGHAFKPRNNKERSQLKLKRPRVSCGEDCRRELRRIQQAKRRGSRPTLLVPQVPLKLAA